MSKGEILGVKRSNLEVIFDIRVVQKTAKFPIDSRLSANFPISREWKSVSRLFAIFPLSNFVENHCILLAMSQHYLRARQIYYYTATIWLDFSSESLLN